MKNIKELCAIVRETSFAIHVYFGNGYLEKVYENTLTSRLCKQGLVVQQQYPLHVYDEDGTLVGQYFADLLIEDSLIVELKACQQLTDIHTAQVLSYLKSTKIKDALLINFGSYQFQIRKFAWSQKSKRIHF
ncbi:MAG: hypothetical protein A3F67_07475 [Verrucomicrobia bacterium RIFCSPHIGHO2_12_FULL_41_10]|nr:MAG: hypothetical protein A3F67_07475 [Verrucomicrobia bacterium RIFCSPHIGHO2_12_FULL_41_10]HLB32803.1 GxxExxY protein [Chthoniobacterales bacterium]